MDVTIKFGIKFCSRYSFPEVCTTKNGDNLVGWAAQVANVGLLGRQWGPQWLQKEGWPALARQVLSERGPWGGVGATPKTPVSVVRIAQRGWKRLQIDF